MNANEQQLLDLAIELEVLPAELAAFLCMFDGLRFSWRATMPQRVSVLVGSIASTDSAMSRAPIDCPNSVFLSGERGGSSGATFAAFSC